ncbi:MAG: hypothetical protein ACTSPB_01675 [Candidatus Thorarchaeota archaeon]
MSSLGERLGRKIRDLETSDIIGSITHRSKLMRERIRFTVSWTFESRSPDYTFTVGESALGVDTIGKGAWTEVASSAD